MALDQWQARAAANTRNRHQEQIVKNAREAAEYAGCIVREVAAGRTPSYAGVLLACASAIIAHQAAVEAVDEVLRIAETDDAP